MSWGIDRLGWRVGGDAAAQGALAGALLPHFDFVIRLLQSDFVASLPGVKVAGQWMLEAIPFLLHPVPLTDEAGLRAFVELPPFFVEMNHALVPPLLLTTATASWHSSGWREPMLRLVLAMAALPALLALTTPLLIVGRVQMWILELTEQHRAGLHEPALVTATIFMESGGRWLLPLGLAVVAVTLSQPLCFGLRTRELPNAPASIADHAEVVFPPVDVEAVPTVLIRSGADN